MLHTTDVLIDRQPAAHPLDVEDLRVVVGRRIAQVVPGRVDERVHRVGVTRRVTAALRASHRHPVRRTLQRRLATLRAQLVTGQRQLHRQLVVRYRHLAAATAVHDRDRAAPVALARQQPVAQPVSDRLFAVAIAVQIGRDGGDCLRLAQAVVGAAVDQHAVATRRDAGLLGVGIAGVDDDAHRQVERAREVQVALVVSGHGHDRAGAIVGQHVVSGEHRDVFTIDRVDCHATQWDTGFLAALRQPFDLGGLTDLLDVRREFLAVVLTAQLGGQRRVRGDDEEGCAEQRVRPRREDADRHLVTLDAEVDVRTGGLADPVALHRQHAVRPLTFQQRHVVQQPLGVRRDPEEPLRQVALRHRRPAALTVAGDHLLVGQHGLVDRAPVDRRRLAIGQTALIHPQEQPLRPAVVLGVRSVQARAPVDRDAQSFEGLRLRLDVLVGPLAWVLTSLQRGVLGGQAEGVPADRVQHVVAAHHRVARDCVADAESLGVAHVQVTAGIAEHVDDVPALERVVIDGLVDVQLVPDRQPFVDDRVRVVAGFVALGGHFSLSSSPRANAVPLHEKGPRAGGLPH